MKKWFIISMSLFLIRCQSPEATPAVPTVWRAALHLNDSTDLPFLLEWLPAARLRVYNGKDTIVMLHLQGDESGYRADFPVFNAYLSFQDTGDTLYGFWHYLDKADDFKVPFTAVKGSRRFTGMHQPCCALDAPWAFTIGDREAPHAVSDFTSEAQAFFGSIITVSGDYRYLEGILDGQQLEMATFDGAFAYYFKATIANDTAMSGHFFSSSTTVKPFVAAIQSDFQLEDPTVRTFLKDSEAPFAFAFPGLDGDTVHFPSGRFANKVTIVQILGSWCPNCLDESVFLTELYHQYHDQGLEIVGLAFERTDDFDKSVKAMQKMQADLGMPYPLLFAGKAGAKEAAEALPMLNAVLAYPTSIFIDASGRVRKIHTGFSGLGTSRYAPYEEEVRELIETLLAERL
jgi:thiol-disulfide isomerase/thioredoxin